MLDVVIVNWNSGEQLDRCLSSFLPCYNELSISVTVVDNGSKDGSEKSVEKYDEAKLLQLDKNYGFARACNIGAGESNQKYVLFLNPDTIVNHECLLGSVQFLEDDANSNIAVCGIALENEENKIERSCAYKPTFLRLVSATLGLDRMSFFRSTGVHMRDWDHQSTRSVDHVIGAFYLIRREVFSTLGGFDEDFFVYIEDLDLSSRVKDVGYDIVYLRDYIAFHAGGGTSRQVKDRRLFYSIRSRLIYSAKNLAVPYFWVIFLLTVTAEPCVRILNCFARGDISGVTNTLSAYKLLLADTRNIISYRGDERD